MQNEQIPESSQYRREVLGIRVILQYIRMDRDKPRRWVVTGLHTFIFEMSMQLRKKHRNKSFKLIEVNLQER